MTDWDTIRKSIDKFDKKANAGLNVLAMNRRSKPNMKPFIADDGYSIVSCDVGGAEPNMMLGFSEDPMLEFFIQNSKGKEPFWKDGILFTDSMYVTFASSNILGKEQVETAYKHNFDGKHFGQMWLEDADVCKDFFNSHFAVEYYRAWKMLTLALFYGLGAKGLVSGCYDNMIMIDLEKGKSIHKAFWKMFKELDRFQKQLQAKFRRSKFMTNPFGFKLNTEEHKVLNAYIQSTVSSFISYLLIYIDEQAPWAKYVTTVHDEIIYQIPEGREDEFIQIRDHRLAELNKALGFKYPLKLGAVWGNNWYDAH